MKPSKAIIFAAVLEVWCSSIGYAAPPIPATVDAGRPEQDVQPPPQPMTSESTVHGSARRIEMPAGVEKIEFVLQDIILEGGHHYKSEELLAPYAAWKGKKIHLSQIYEVAADITDRYHRDGFSFMSASLPPQQIANGVVRIHIVEGFVSRVVLGDLAKRSFYQDLSKKYTDMHPLNMEMLQEDLLLFNDLPGTKIKAFVEADAESKEEGALVLKLEEQHAPVNAYAELNNFGSLYSGPDQLSTQGQLNGMFRDYDQTSLGTFNAFPYAEMHYFSLKYSIPLDLRTAFSVNGSTSHGAPAYTLREQEIRSSSDSLSFNMRHQFIRSRAEDFSMGLTFDANNLETDTLNTLLYDDRIRALRLSGNYDTVDRWQGVDLVSVTASQGFNAFGARPTGSMDLSRAEGKSDFNKFEMTMSRLQPVSDMVSLYMITQGQTTGSPLLASEQFGFGGGYIGRAYNPSEITGDRGVSYSAELRYYGVPDVESIQLKTQPFLFYDVGRIWNLSTHGDIFTAASDGVGARMQLFDDISLSTTLAWPAMRKQSAPLGQFGDPRWDFSLSYHY